MGDLLRRPNSLHTATAAAAAGVVDTPAQLPPTTTPQMVSNERSLAAEKTACELISKVFPTDASGRTRRGIICYVYKLIKCLTGCEVFPYGSVPLKTYLPDGDIDLTVISGAISEDSLADDIVSLLEREGRNDDAEFIVKDVQLIRAEVKIVKCIVQNVVVDISLNQLGGLCTLCFLEQVDRLIGRDNLFKRSVIVIKTWCYYESRILGAPHGLISTYALETLVLYIFNHFHSSLVGPLSVLYKFLDHFSKFDWDNYAITINGPVRSTSLSELRAEVPENGGTDLLLKSDFLRNCVEVYSVPSRGGDFNSRAFPLKNLNIVDPLKGNNNLGRSVSKGNFYRIRSAFTFGAKKLGSILTQQECNLKVDLKKFFSNTFERHGSIPRPVVLGPEMLPSEINSLTQKVSIPEGRPSFYIGMIDASSPAPNGSCTDDNNEKHAATFNAKQNGRQNGYYQECRSESVRLAVNHQLRISGDAKDHTSYKTSLNEAQKPDANTFSLRHRWAPHLYIIPSASGKSRSETSDSLQSRKCENNTRNSCGSEQVNGHAVENGDVDSDNVTSSGGLKDSVSPIKTRPVTADQSPESSETMSNLRGDLETHVHCLLYARFCFENPLFPHVRTVASSSPPPPPYYPWVAVPAAPFYPIRLVPPGLPYSAEDIQRPRGTGTYFPNPVPVNRYGHVFNRPPFPKERYYSSSRNPGTGRGGGMITETNNRQSQSTELEQQGRVKIVHSSSNSNTVQVQPENSMNAGSKEAAPVVERNHQQRKEASIVIQNVSPVAAPSAEEDLRVLKKSSYYHLKDNGDFPPL